MVQRCFCLKKDFILKKHEKGFTHYINDCLSCVKTKATSKVIALETYHVTLNDPHEKLSVDQAGMLPCSSSHWSIVILGI